MDWIQIIVGVFGLGLIINAIIILVSSKYYSFFSRTYFIEPASEPGKEKVKKKIDEEKNAQRYGLSIICIGLGVTGVSWSFEAIKSITFPFFILAAIAVAYVVFGGNRGNKVKR